MSNEKYGKVVEGGAKISIAGKYIIEEGKTITNPTIEQEIAAGYKLIVEEPIPTTIPDGKKAIPKITESATSIVKDWEIVDKTQDDIEQELNMKIWELESQQTPELIRKAILKDEKAIAKLQEIDGEVEKLKKQL